jgi:hypothetical protein
MAPLDGKGVNFNKEHLDFRSGTSDPQSHGEIAAKVLQKRSATMTVGEKIRISDMVQTRYSESSI